MENLIKDRVSWISHQKDLLEKERLAEIEASIVQAEDVTLKHLEAKGIAISRLIIDESFTGPFGQHTITLTPRHHQHGVSSPLPSNSFSSGDVIGLWEMGASQKSQIASGVVSKVTSTSIQVAIDDDAPELDELADGTLIRIHKLVNDITYQRIKKGLEDLSKLINGPSHHLIEVLFKETEPYKPLPEVPSKLLREAGELDLFNKSLDKSQIEAVRFALMQKDLAVIHGPPGTGKTTTLVEIILQHVKLGCKILACAPSNLAVDNLLERLVDCRVNIVRVGHPARATPKARQRTLDALVQKSDDFSLIKDIHKDISASLLTLSKTKDKGRRTKIRMEVKYFRKELKQREIRLSKDILSRSQVVLSTLTSAGNAGPLKLLSENNFDLTVIDECSQGMECACYLSAMKAPKLLIAGDHQQLPPTVLSTEAAKEGLLISLMERIIEIYKDQTTRMLKTQYRMNTDIMVWASNSLYDGQLEAHSSVSNHLLCQMEDVDSVEDTENALVLIDTAGCDFEEISGEDLSKGNEGEATIVAEQVKKLVSLGVQQKDLAVITPYNFQVELIRGLLRDEYPSVEVRSVDGFQGREKEAVIISLVRSNKQGEIGFLSEERRLNVAVTRARRHLTLVGDSDTVCRNAFIRSLVTHITSRGIVKSGFEFDSGREQCARKPPLKTSPLDLPKLKEKKKREKPHQPDEEDNERRKKELEKRISDFIKCAEQTCLEFPKKLNSFERFLVHEIAEQNGLVHESREEGEERFILLRKKNENELKIQTNEENKGNETGVCESNLETKNVESVTKESTFKHERKGKGKVNKKEMKQTKTSEKEREFSTHNSLVKESESGDQITNLEKHKKETIKAKENFPQSINVSAQPLLLKPRTIDNCKAKQTESRDHNIDRTNVVTKCCEICRNEIPCRNFDLHVLRCEKLRNEKQIKDQISKRKTEIKGVNKLKKSKEKTQHDDDDDDDFEVMERYSKENNSCAFPRCRNPSIILLQLCSFCRNNFCLKHHQAEIHGCGDEAKRHARSTLTKCVKNGVLTPGSGIPSKKPDPVKRGQLQRKLGKRLEDMGNQRKGRKRGTND